MGDSNSNSVDVWCKCDGVIGREEGAGVLLRLWDQSDVELGTGRTDAERRSRHTFPRRAVTLGRSASDWPEGQLFG